MYGDGGKLFFFERVVGHDPVYEVEVEGGGALVHVKVRERRTQEERADQLLHVEWRGSCLIASSGERGSGPA